MQVFDNNELISPIFHRAICLSISKEFAHMQRGEIFVAKYQESEQTFRRRELLAVEQQANQEKVIEQHGQQQFTLQVTEKFNKQLNQKITSEFANKEKLFHQVLGLQTAASDILEILAVNAASIKRITPLTSSLPWLGNDLVNLVNKPQYRKRSLVKVTDSNLAVSYIGLENLKMVMPTYILKHWLPSSTAPFNTLKRKIWQDCLSVAMASKVLAAYYKMDEYFAFTAGMLSNIGTIAITKCFTLWHQELLNNALKNAYDSRDKRLHDTLNQITPAPELLYELFVTHSAKLSAEIVELMRFDRLQITEAIFDLAYIEDMQKMSKLAQLIVKAKAFVIYRNLVNDELLAEDEVKLWLKSSGITVKEIAILKRADIDHIKLQFD